MRIYLLTALLLGFGSTISFSQADKFTISGQIKDASNGEDIAFANITLADQPTVGTNSNVYGFYSISLEPGKHVIQFDYLGYQTSKIEVDLNADTRLDLELEEDAISLGEVVISATREDQNVTRNEGSVTQIDMKSLKEIPAFGGEPDILKVIQMNPGIKTAGEGNAGYYVRGGDLGQNLVLLDEAPVYNPSHLLGLFSVFNGDALKSATLYKGGMAAEYGGRTASVLDVRMKDGNSKDFNVSGGIGLIASRLAVEGPIKKDQGSFMIAGRRTYADLFLGLSNDENLSESSLYFYDLNLKANYRLGENDRVYVSGYFGRDNFGFGETFGLDWGNSTATIRWNHLYSDRLFSNTSIVYGDYDYEFSIGSEEERIGLQSVIKDRQLKQDFTYYPNDRNVLKFGLDVTYHVLEPGNLLAGENTGINAQQADTKYGLEGALYIQNDQQINDKLQINYGLRYSAFQQIGPGKSYTFDDQGDLLNTTNHESGESIQFYHGLEPRVSANYLINSKSSLKFGYNRNLQYLHLLTNATSSTPTDVWIMSSNNVKPQLSNQVGLGYFRNFKDNMYETSAEVYYKYMQNTIDYRNGANLFLNEQLEGDLVYGTGDAYGLELLLKKNKGRLTGWVSYTLSKTTRQFDEINNGEKFSARQDRTHDLSIIAQYKLTDKLSLSGNFIFYTGDAVTFPAGKYSIDGLLVPYYTERNGYRMPNYHRLDLGVTWFRKQNERFESSWNFSLYNAYGRENAYSIDFQPSESDPNVTEAVQLSLFKWIPSFTYNFKFK